MGDVTITARFPLGVFQGHLHDRSPAPYPDTARLMSALMQSASKGSMALERGGDLRAAQASIDALQWLETHPPEAVTLPESQPTRANPRVAFAWRIEGTFDKWSERKTQRRMSSGQAVAGAFAWHWTSVPDSVAQTIESLCADVSCLGETDSPVVLDTSSQAATHSLDISATMLRRPRGGVPMRTPSEGRIELLERSYEQTRPIKTPTTGDAASGSQQPRSSEVPIGGLRTLTYVPNVEPEPPAPWTQVLLLEASAPIESRNRVAWCVALHRMIVSRLGDDAPASITGRYRDDSSRPSNRVAIQYLSAGMLAGAGIQTEHGAFALLVPPSMSGSDQLLLRESLVRPRVYRGEKGSLNLSLIGQRSGSQFWAPVQPGWTRAWCPVPAMVAESRRQKAHPQRGEWTLEHAAKLSVAHVFREELVSAGGQDRWGLVAEVEAKGVSVKDVRAIPDSNALRFAHKVPANLGVLQAYQATLGLGTLGNSRAMIALGQSRHLGGGLLVPVDSLEVES